MRDPVFSASDVSEAVQLASRSLGIDVAAVRYVVLDSGRPAGWGVGPGPARIAVLLDRGPRSTPQVPAEEAYEGLGNAHEQVRQIIRALAKAAEQELSVDIDDSGEAFRIELSGAGTALFLDEKAEVLKAVEHILDRACGHLCAPQRIRLICEGFREHRDEALRKQTRELAHSVALDGQPRGIEALNSYERRIVHLAIEKEAGLRSYSTGEGRSRRVIVALEEGPAKYPDS